MKRITLIMLLGMMSLGLNAQKTMEIGLFGGGSYYLGDMNPGKHFIMTKPAFGLITRLNLDPRWAVKISAYQGEVLGDDRITKAVENREMFFKSQITDISAVLEFNFFNYVTGSTRNFLAPYIFGGIGLFMFNPEADGVSLPELGTEGQNVNFNARTPYSTTQLAIPFGLGFKYSLNKRLGFAFEWGMRKTFTDYIDDVSQTYYLDGESINPSNTAEYYSDPTMDHSPYVARGNSSNMDWYAFFGISITYKFRIGGNDRCTDTGLREDY